MNETHRTYKILVADDDIEIARRIKGILASVGYETVQIKSRFKSLKELEGYDLVILDVVWSGEKKPRFEIDDYFGFRGAEYLRQNFSNSKIILMSRQLFEIEHVRKIASLPNDYFKSDDHPSEILNIISRVVNNYISDREIIAKQIDVAVQSLSEVKEHPDLLGLDISTHASLFRLIPLLYNSIVK
jgi:CheY-like chemotaxis protein